MVRSRNAKAVELEKLGAEIVTGSLTNYAELTNALKDVKRVYYYYPFTPSLLNGTKMFVRAATAQNIKAVVNIEQWLAEFDNQSSVHTHQIKEAYKVFEQSEHS